MRLPRRPAARAAWAVIVALGAILMLVAVSYAGGATLSLVARRTPDGIEATAVLADPQGRAVSGVTVAFLRRTTFGWLEVARLDTGAGGTARAVMALPPGLVPEIKAVAEVGDQTVEQLARLDLAAAREAPIRPGETTLEALSPQPGFISPYPPVRLLATLMPVLLGVWVTYAVVVYQLTAIARNR